MRDKTNQIFTGKGNIDSMYFPYETEDCEHTI